MPSFRATLDLHGKTATGISVPEDVVIALGAGRKPPVSVRLGTYTYRTTVAPRGGGYLLPVSAEIRAATGLSAGDEVDVQLDVDTAPREVDVPPELAAALAKDSAAGARFETLSYSNRLRHALDVSSAKTDETRDRRLANVLAALQG